MAGDLQTLREKGVFRRSWKFRELQVRDPKKSRNLIAVLCYFCEWFDFGVLCGFGIAPGVDRRRGDSACVRQQITLP